MSTNATPTSEWPSIADLLWDADRRSLLELDDETRTLLEKIGEQIAEQWPINDGPPLEYEVDQLEDSDDWPGFVRELATNGVKIEPDDEPDPEQVVLAVATSLQEARAEGEKDATIPSRANTAERKAMRLLVERRVAVKTIDPQIPYVLAEVRGDSGVYTCGYHPTRRGWRCTCPNPAGNCSHVAAVKMIAPIEVVS